MISAQVLFTSLVAILILSAWCFYTCLSPQRRKDITQACLKWIKGCSADDPLHVRVGGFVSSAATDNDERKQEEETGTADRRLRADGESDDGSSATEWDSVAFWKSVRTKIKIIVAAWQITSSTEFVFLRIKLPKSFSKVMRLFGVLGLAIFDVGSTKCFLGWSYFEELLFVTLAPFGFILLLWIVYWLINWCRWRWWCWCCIWDETQQRTKDTWNNFKYWTLFFIYIILPSVSSYVITYLRCERFDRGDKKDLEVMAVELSVNCRSTRYKGWRIYDIIMIVIWPVGTTLGLAILLWLNRKELNPEIFNGPPDDEPVWPLEPEVAPDDEPVWPPDDNRSSLQFGGNKDTFRRARCSVAINRVFCT